MPHEVGLAALNDLLSPRITLVTAYRPPHRATFFVKMINMALTMVRFFFAAALLCAAVSAQDCQIPSEISGLTLRQVQAKLAEGRQDFFLYKRWIDLTPSKPKPGPLAAEFQKKLEQQHSDDARFLYLYGFSLIGKDTPQAIVYLNRAASTEPKLPWTYIALASIYSTGNFADNSKLLANFHTFRGLCPANLDGFRYLNKVRDSDNDPELDRELRPLLEASHDARDADLWRVLWAAEFRLTPKQNFPALRQRVANDVKRLEAWMPSHDRALLGALMDGYHLSAQPESAARIEKLRDPDSEYLLARRVWEDKYNLRARTQTAEEHKIFMQDLAKQSADWIVKWPNSLYAWEGRLTSLTFAPAWTKQEMEQAGEEVLKLEAEQDYGWTYVPNKLRVAQTWAKNGVRLKDAVRLAEEVLDQLSLGPEVANDLTPNGAKFAAAQMFGFDLSTWDAMAAIVEASCQLRDFDQAESMLWKMRHWLDDNAAKRDDQTSGYTLFQGRYFRAAGDIAEAKGRQLDAAGFFAKSLSLGYRDPDLNKRGLALWQEAGGSEEAWQALASRPGLPKPVSPKPRASPVQTASAYEAWKPVAKPLPEMTLADLPGKTWTLANLKGKTTFVNVWATWCGPCMAELPNLQKLYDLARTRDDIQVITFNIDENPGEVEPYMKAKNYTFPVVMSARKYVEAVTEHFAIPMNWLVDRSAVLEMRNQGWDATLPDWPRQMLEKLTEVSR